MMSIQEETDEQKKIAKEMRLEIIEFISSDGTFLNPKIDDETDHWGYRRALLENYRRIKGIIENHLTRHLRNKLALIC